MTEPDMHEVEFLVLGVQSDSAGAIVSGVVNKGKVTMGRIFSRAKSDITGDVEVKLAINKIVTYRREINSLPRGMSGDLHLTGTGIEALKDHDILAY
jgi:hypothetical protein